jgi:hypothetical protein
MGGWNAVAQPLIRTQQLHPSLASRAIIAFVNRLLGQPIGEAITDFFVLRFEEGKAEVFGGSAWIHDAALAFKEKILLNAEDAKVTQKTQKRKPKFGCFFFATSAKFSRPLRSKMYFCIFNLQQTQVFASPQRLRKPA